MWICQKIHTVDNFIKILFLFLLVSTVLLDHNVVMATDHLEENPNEHAVILLVPDLSFEEMNWIIHNTEHSHLWTSGAYGAINLRPDGNYSYLNNAVSLSVGKKALGVMGWNAYERGEEVDGTAVENLYLQWYGVKPIHSLIHPQFHLLKTKNEQGSFAATVGWLGEALKEKGVYTYVLGNSDTREDRERYASLFIMDQQGGADGDLHGIIEEDTSVPTGKKTSPKKLVDNLKELQENHLKSFSVVEWGDLHRFFSENANLTPIHSQRMYERTLRRLEATIADLVTSVDGEVWLVSPTVNNDAYRNKNQLGPLWVWTKDHNAQAVLYSSTTRRYSVISNTDMADTWLAAFGAGGEISLGLGQPLQLENNNGQWSYENFQQRIKEINHVYENRGAVLSSYVSSLVILLIIVSFMIWLLKDDKRWKDIAGILLLSAVLSPLWFLITSPVVLLFHELVYVLVIMLGSLVTALLFKKIWREPFSKACLLFFLVLSIDIVLEGYLTERSFLSYDPVIGARYYGIGNEFAGIFIACGVLMIAPFVTVEKKTISGNFSKTILPLSFVFLLLILLLGTSSFGANAGASLSVVIIMIYVTVELLLKRQKLWVKALVAMGVIVGMLGVMYVLQLSQPSSHIAMAFQQLVEGDLQTIFQTIKRKLQMNWKIFKVSYWTQLFITSYFLIGLVLWKRKKNELRREQTLLINCSIVGSLALLVLNDSGIVAAATSMFITLSVCYGWSLKKSQ